MASNQEAFANEDEYPDWVELYNTSPSDVDIGGWSLTDDILSPRKYVFPAGTIIGPGQFLIVFCDSSILLPGLHTGFGLDDNGELLALYRSPAAGSTISDYIPFGLQVTDLSIGRSPDGVGVWGLHQSTPGEPNVALPLAPAAGNLFINEWMAVDLPNDDWLELYNAAPNPVSLAGLVFTDSLSPPANRALPNLSFIGAGGFIQFIADDLENTDADHLDFKLSSTNGETNTLYAADRVTVIDRVMYGPQTQGVSQGRLPDGSANIVFFPGKDTAEASNFLLITNIAFNEILTHTDPPLEDAVELLNLSAQQIDIGNWWLSNSKSDVKKFRIPPGTILQPFGFKVYYEYQFNPSGTGNSPSFTLNSSQGDEIYLHSADAAGNLTGQRGSEKFGASENGVSFGRYLTSDGRAELVPMSSRSFGVDNPATVTQFRTGTGLPNPAPGVGPVVINELMYHPPDIIQGTNRLDNSLDEYIELHNLLTDQVLLYDPLFPTNTWRLDKGVNYKFPQMVSIPERGYLLVVNFNPFTNATQLNVFKAKYQVPANVGIYGPYSGKLDNRGEAIELQRPDTPQPPGRPDAGFVPYLEVDRVDYEDRAPWTVEPDGSGLALQRCGPELFGDDPANWMGSIASPGLTLVEIDSVERSGQNVLLTFRQVMGFSYSVQVSDRIAGGNWAGLAHFTPQTQTQTREFTHLGAAGAGPRFYRLVTPMSP